MRAKLGRLFIYPVKSAAGIECERVHLLTREAWAEMHHRLVDELHRGVAQSGPDASHRIKIGIYVLHEDTRDASTPPAPAVPSDPSDPKGSP